MIAVVFFAMLVDRPAISLRNLAIAALIILVREPEQAVAASFQMSFMAVMGLAAFYEFWSRREQESRPIRRGIPAAVGLYLWRIAWMSVVTTLIAGTLSGIPASYHFGRMAPYGVLANGLALPVVGAVVMPAALISVLLMPLGLEAYPLYIMGEGLKVVILISDWVAGLPGAGAALPQAGVWPMLFLATGFAVLCLAGGTLRYAGILPLLLALPLIAGGKGPDVLIEGTGANVAVRDGERRWVPADPRKGRFAVERWLTANGEEETLAKAAKRPGWTCGNGSCSAVENDRKILFLNDENRQPASCPKADVVIANYPLRGLCKGHPLRIDRFDLWRRGSHALTFTGAGIVVTTAREEQGARPWFVDPRSRSRAEQPQGPSAP
jgi:competence protein ComEC